MAFDLSSLQTEITNFSTALENYLKAESDYASDPTKPAPNFSDFLSTFVYKDLASASYVNAGSQASLVVGAMMNEVYRMFALEREFNHAYKSKAQYYSDAVGQFSNDEDYEKLYSIESLKYLTGTSPYQGGSN